MSRERNKRHLVAVTLGENPYSAGVHPTGFSHGGVYTYVRDETSKWLKEGGTAEILGRHTVRQAHELNTNYGTIPIRLFPSIAKDGQHLPDNQEVFEDPQAADLTTDLTRHLSTVRRAHKKPLVHAHHWFSVLGVRAARDAGLRVIFTPHVVGKIKEVETGIKCSDTRFAVEREGFMDSDHTIVNSQQERAMIIDLYAKDRRERRTLRRKIHVLHPGVDTDYFNPERRQDKRVYARTYFGIPQDANLVFATAGRLDPQKNFGSVLKGFNEFLERSKRDDAYLLLVTGNEHEKQTPYYKELQKQIASFPDNVRQKIILSKFVEDPLLIYAASDFFVTLSKNESFGLTLLEAMSCGVPAIVSNIPSLLSITGYDKTRSGMVCNLEGDNGATGSNLSKIMSNVARLTDLQALQSNALKNAGRYSWEKYIDELKRISN